jgi:uncharacterized repeat protein (TIGR03803 family)
LRFKRGFSCAAAGFAGALFVALSADATAETFRVLHSFEGNADGANPESAPYVDLGAGLVVGTTPVGGQFNLGTAYEIGLYGDFYKVVHSFGGPGDGQTPKASLVAYGADLYGTASRGGSTGGGVVFRMNHAGHTTILHAFPTIFEAGKRDGIYPDSSLTVDAAGNLYGTTSSGGYFETPGSVYRVTQGGQESLLGTFDRLDHTPRGGVIFGNDGNLYGTTQFPLGSVYKLSPAGGKVVYIGDFHAFGRQPVAGLVKDSRGNFYGTTFTTLYAPEAGNVFETPPNGPVSMVYTFRRDFKHDGANPAGGVAIGLDGYLYGTTEKGGVFGCGTVFKLKPFVAYAVLVNFNCGTDGKYPRAGLVADPRGDFFGTTAEGGAKNQGVLFKISR